MDGSNLSSISQSNTSEQIGEFWDIHDFSDFDNDAPDVEFEIVRNVPIDTALFSQIEQQARQRGIKVETLINLWLQQKLTEQVAS